MTDIAERVAAMTPDQINRIIAERVHGWRRTWHSSRSHPNTYAWYRKKNEHTWVFERFDYDPYHNPAQAMGALREFNKRHSDAYISWNMIGTDHCVFMRCEGYEDFVFYECEDGKPEAIISRAIVAAILEGDECSTEKK